jgi:hypothetical protein
MGRTFTVVSGPQSMRCSTVYTTDGAMRMLPRSKSKEKMDRGLREYIGFLKGAQNGFHARFLDSAFEFGGDGPNSHAGDNTGIHDGTGFDIQRGCVQ